VEVKVKTNRIRIYINEMDLRGHEAEYQMFVDLASQKGIVEQGPLTTLVVPEAGEVAFHALTLDIDAILKWKEKIPSWARKLVGLP
jgi:hypothetical protein